MVNRKICNICIILAVLLVVTPALEAVLTVNTVSAQANNATDTVPTFSIVWISDTQYLSESYPSDYDNLCNWIVSNNQTYNIKMVVHTGDIVDTTNSPTQWANANHSMSILLDNNIPYCWDAGNHDYSSACWIGDQYLAFNPTYLAQQPYWVSSCEDGLSTAVNFNVSGWDCLIINIAFDADATSLNGYTLGNPTLNWLETLLNAYPDAHVIVATHDYLGLDCSYDSWGASLEAVLNQYPNVFMTLNGHYWTTEPTTSTNRTEVGDRWELMWNFQGLDNETGANTGAESARILTFDVAADTVSVQTCALFENQFLTDSNNKFTLTTDFRNDAAPMPTPTATQTPTPSQTLTFPSGSLLTITSDSGESLSFTAAQILAMPTASGLGGYTQYDDGDFYDTGTYVGVPLLYLCDLVGGLNPSSSVTEYCLSGYQTTLNYQEIYNATAGFSGSLFNPATEYEQNPTQPITLVLAYEYDGGNLPSGQGNFRVMAVGPEGLVSWESYAGSEITELAITNSPKAMGFPSLTFNTCNSAGTNQSTFNPGSSVYFTATGLSPETTYPVYLVPTQNWAVGMTIPAPTSTVNVKTNSAGNVAPTLICNNAEGGQYDVLVKTVNVNDDTYDSQDLILTNVVSTPGPGVSVLTFPSGPILTVTSDSGQTMQFTAAQILAMPKASGLGGYTRHDDGDFFYMGSYVGVPLQYLCNLVGGLQAYSQVQVADVNTQPTAAVTLSYTDVTNMSADTYAYPFFNPTTGVQQTPASPVTLIVAYEYNGANLPSDVGPLRLMAVDSQGLVTWGSYSTYCVDTIKVSYAPSLSYYTCDASGNSQSTFNAGESVYLSVSGLYPHSTAATGAKPGTAVSYNVEVVPYQSTWTVGMAIPTPVATTTYTTDTSGDLDSGSPVLIYADAAPGQYDIIVKNAAETDGTWDAQDLLITEVVATPGPAFVAPEYAFGALCAFAACFVAFIVYTTVKSGIGIQKNRFQQKGMPPPSTSLLQKA